MGLSFTPRLRDRVASGEITETLRFWLSPRAKVGGRYPVPGGAVEVTRMVEIDVGDVDLPMALRQGFDSVEDLLAVARHGRGERVFVVEFAYWPD